MAKRGVKLTWQEIDCIRCGAKRIRGRACQECGLEPKAHEFNRPLQVRQKASNAALAVLEGERPLASPIHVLELARSPFWTQTATWIDQLLEALAQASSGAPSGEAGLTMAVKEFTELHAQASALRPLRPFVRQQRAATRVVVRLEQMLVACLNGLAAETPVAAQAASALAQRHLDAATALLPDLADSTQQDIEEADSARDLLAALLRRAAATTADGSIMSLFEKPPSALAELLGQPPGDSASLRYLLVEPISINYLDAERFESVVRAGFDVLQRDLPALARLGSLNLFQEDLARARLGFFDASQQAWRILKSTTVPRQAARALVELASEFVEGAGQTVCAALLVCTGAKTRPYERLRHDDATDLLRSARAHPDLEPLLHGLDPDLRNAAAHRAYTVTDEGDLQLDLRSAVNKAIASDDLVDGLFQAMESVLALLIALEAALSVAGVLTEDDEPLTSLGIEPAEAAALAMEVVLGTPIVGVREAASFRLTIQEPGVRKLSPGVAAAVSQTPKDVESITVEYVDKDAKHHVFSGPTDPYRDFALADPGLSKEIAFIRCQRSWLTDGLRVVSNEAMRLWLARQAVQALEAGFPGALIPLRALRHFALDEADELAASVLTDAMRDVRLKAAGASDVSSRYVDLLARWGSATVVWDPP